MSKYVFEPNVLIFIYHRDAWSLLSAWGNIMFGRWTSLSRLFFAERIPPNLDEGYLSFLVAFAFWVKIGLIPIVLTFFSGLAIIFVF